ncbi:uncharacterized protein [Parasteatoda tepidariorum]|uniref:uncharacterized protein n=1 Tax=Parasteatoda tepidariorum TaxID=114398 RepID=UPI001C71EB87|nr:uncharacterized protein LOC122270543 [Parasteatoda tepidariorum]
MPYHINFLFRVNVKRSGVKKYGYLKEDGVIEKKKGKPFNHKSFFKDVVLDNYDVIKPFVGRIGSEYLDLNLAQPENLDAAFSCDPSDTGNSKIKKDPNNCQD